MFFKNKSKSRRFFAFGCSLTRYYYPTWADIIGRQFDYYENWGRPGAGNLYILNSIMECHQRNQLCADDFVVVLWSGLSRIDSYQINEWSHFHGMILDQQTKDLPVSCVDGYEIIGYAYISAIENVLENLKVEYQMMHATSYDHSSRAGVLYKKTLNRVKEYRLERNKQYYPPSESKEKNKQIANLYQRLAGKDWPSLDKLLNGQYHVPEWLRPEIDDFFQRIEVDKRFNIDATEIDYHPLPTHHLSAVKKYFPNIEIPEKDQLWIKDIEAKVLAGEPYDFDRHLPKYRL